MPLLELTPDELLSTTRAVRRRLDLTRPVERDVLEQCVRLAVQAPTSTNTQNWHFVIVTDRPSGRRSPSLPTLVDSLQRRQAARRDDRRHGARPPRRASARGARHVIPCITGRPEGLAPTDLAWFYGSIIQAGWSFQLAARARGLGSVWTTHHLDYEREAADVLGIPFDDVTQVALIPVAYTIGTNFKPARRKPLETVLHWQAW